MCSSDLHAPLGRGPSADETGERVPEVLRLLNAAQQRTRLAVMSSQAEPEPRAGVVVRPPRTATHVGEDFEVRVGVASEILLDAVELG